MQNKFVVFIGGAATGKSTLEKILEDNGFIRVVSHTTRKPREKEIPGINYHFINNIVFELYSSQGLFVEETIYKGYRYGINKNDVNLERGNHVAVLDKEGLNGIINALGKDRVISILIKASETVLLTRMLKRDVNTSKKDALERISYDNKVLMGVEDEVDYIIDNQNNSVKGLLNEVSEILIKEGLIVNKLKL